MDIFRQNTTFIRGKYVKTSVGSCILIPPSMNHSDFKNWNVVSGGMFDLSSVMNSDTQETMIEVKCYGKSMSLGVCAHEDDATDIAQMFDPYL